MRNLTEIAGFGRISDQKACCKQAQICLCSVCCLAAKELTASKRQTSVLPSTFPRLTLPSLPTATSFQVFCEGSRQPLFSLRPYTIFYDVLFFRVLFVCIKLFSQLIGLPTQTRTTFCGISPTLSSRFVGQSN
ncbi:hypothetical protein PISMIDRAFT_264928 [Pisolithus microcarpus 441]|uniref:Uncharacterized protein n=1 Tax=Pisolithus microcarpus 441 TaxID=765257 RepID=A0A0C9YNL5_9AGAM|nr:hypothetical protein PISMIDRAFT_264928 [Pisolithus microcarpus 441]